jgi:uncharacterized membrane protein YtjA (UPF0391 family)
MAIPAEETSRTHWVCNLHDNPSVHGSNAVQTGAAKGKTGPVCHVHLSGLTTNPKNMLYYTLVFFVVAIIAAILGFGGIAGAAAGIAKICFFVFIVLAVLSLLFGKKPSV